MKLIMESWKRFLNEEQLDPKLDNEIKNNVLKSGGFKLKTRIQMATSSPQGKEMYSKILAALQQGAYGEAGKKKAEDIVAFGLGLEPAEGEWTAPEVDAGPQVEGKPANKQYYRMHIMPSYEAFQDLGSDPLKFGDYIKNRFNNESAPYIEFTNEVRKLREFGLEGEEAAGVRFNRLGAEHPEQKLRKQALNMLNALQKSGLKTTEMR